MSGVPGYELHGVMVRGSACVRAYVRSDGFGRDWRVYWLSIKGQDTRARYYVGVAYRDPDILAALGRPGIRRSGLVPGAIEGFDSAVFAEMRSDIKEIKS